VVLALAVPVEILIAFCVPVVVRVPVVRDNAFVVPAVVFAVVIESPEEPWGTFGILTMSSVMAGDRVVPVLLQ
jgi:hypothetical protein